MIFKIWHKLALILIVSITMAVVISTLLSQRSFKNSFSEYVEQQEEQQLETLAQNLISRYEEDNNWSFIRNKKRVWMFYLRLKPEQSAVKDDRTNRRIRREERIALRQERDLIRAIPAENKAFKLNQKRNQLALVDKNKQIIVGAILAQDGTEYFPLKSNEQVIAYIQRKKFTGITDRLDKIFANKQDQAFLFNTLSTLLISICVAIFISIYFRKRINALTEIAHELTSGHYDKRVNIQQKDELGQLGQDFNTLAKTLQKNQQSQQHWIADISHELRTPLAILKGELQALEEGVRPLSNDAVVSLQQETERLNQLVEDLYQLSVADMGALKYEKRLFDIKALLTEVKDNFMMQFEQHKLSLLIDCQTDEAILFNGDKQRVYQLLSNLLQNSLRYTDSNGQVCIHCHTNDNNIVLIIADSAPGISEEKLPYIFDRLFRLENSRSRSNGGAGLGLAIAKQIVLAHQGEISAQASEMGGLSITINLPKSFTQV